MLDTQFTPGPHADSWLERHWHPLCGFTYLAICLIDFCIMPVFYEYTNHLLSPEKIVNLAMLMKDGPSQIQALTILHNARVWQPLTLSQSGLFHIAFGAILGVGIWSAGSKVKTDALNNLSNQMQTIASNQQQFQSQIGKVGQ
jgi:hypothetical protein